MRDMGKHMFITVILACFYAHLIRPSYSFMITHSTHNSWKKYDGPPTSHKHKNTFGQSYHRSAEHCTLQLAKGSAPERFLAQLSQRIESLKSAVVGGAAVGGTRLALTVLDGTKPWNMVNDVDTLSRVIVEVGSATLEGALFGLLYRYVIRSDMKKPKDELVFSADQLGGGAAAAFALTSFLPANEERLSRILSDFLSLALQLDGKQADLGTTLMESAYTSGSFALSFIGFLVAKITIDSCLDAGIISPVSD
eukprot:CAMPEP_0113944030 /NCGR_PEP_ID=MMETSP1339-20121228/30588_1 /TAXON_ID=94617 /ORGANISM="Fibrocapsa japonica" /LENGTH=251 /DNA_ID=CAMNT_0000949079 /DNA_START=23 /DNA_END=778 /DNA_ORIENTATION=- /assembly_acc=CAM_ASM_000762